MNSAPIGIFDSGVGGLSVLREVHRQFPQESLIFIADQKHVPYGPRSLEQVRAFSEALTQFLLDQGIKLIVVACNTASAAALYHLRAIFPDIPFVGMEPAVKPAAEQTQSGVVGVLATPATFQGELYASVVERFANGVTVLQETCPGLVQQIEKGELNAPATRAILESALHPMMGCEIDRVVMGCTHYPFVIPLIQEIVGPGVKVIDPAPAIARQVGRLLTRHALHNQRTLPIDAEFPGGLIQYLTTDDPLKLQALLPLLIREQENVAALHWHRDKLQFK